MISIQRQGILLCLLGPAGSGKTTLSKRLLQEFEGTLLPSVSYTTREPRPNEQHGEHYFFVSREEFKAREKSGEFFEWEEVHGNLYGTPRKPLENAIAAGVDIVLDIDIQGALTFKKTFANNVVSIFILPPSIAELRRRIVERGVNNDEEVTTRLETARKEFETFLSPASDAEQVQFCLVNDDLEETFELVKGIIFAERSRTKRLDRSFMASLCEVQ